jgi:DNA primase catalytic core
MMLKRRRVKKFRDFDLVKEDLRVATDLVSFISRYVDLQQRGKRWLGICPFHDNEHTPKFAVSPDAIYEPSQSKGVWACWVCEERGDLYAFVMKKHDASFIEAISIIAEATGFDLNPYYRDLTPQEEYREQQYQLTERVADLFCDELLNNKKKLHYFAERGIESEILREFKVGWSPSIDFLQAHVDRDAINLLEPALGNRSRLFGDRIIYTQFNTLGRAWGWFARQPDDRADGIPKYIGTSQESALFDGHDRIYGFSQARKILRASEFPLNIVEGFNDTLAGQQSGFPTVGACGTNLSAKQIETLQSHGIRKAVVAFDPDDGGRKGMFKLAERAHQIDGIQFQFIEMSAEPEEFIANYGPEAYGNCLKNAFGAIDFIINRYADMDTSTATKVRDFLDHVRPYLVLYPRRSLSRALGVRAVAQKTELSEDVITDYLDEKSGELSNLTGELILLSELAQNPQSWVTLFEVSESDFSLNRYKQTYVLMRDLYEREAEVNIELLVTEAHNRHVPPEVLETIGKLSTVQRKTPEIFARDVRDKAIRRQSAEFAERMQRQVRDLKTPVMETIAHTIESVTASMAVNVERKVWSSNEAVTLTIEAMQVRGEAESGIEGLNAGPDFEFVTQMINGFRGGRTFVIAATAGIGKSICAINLVHRLSVVHKDEEHPWAEEAPGLIVSMEMTPEENIERVAAIDSGVPHSFIEHSCFENQQQADLVLASMERIRMSPITWMGGNCTINEIALRCRLLQARGELAYLMLDYVQLLDLSIYSDRLSQVEKYNETSMDIARLARSLDIPIIMVAQLNRSAMGEDLPTGENMGSSYKIYQDAHACLILAPREDGLIGSLDKNRGSGKGSFKIAFDMNPQTSTLRMKETSVLKGKNSR